MIIYKPRGRAAEYAEYAVNIGTGCTHGCKYCYAPAALRMDPETYHLGCTIKKDLLQRLEKGLQKMEREGVKYPVLFCFTIDAYQNGHVAAVTRGCLELFNKYDQNFQILTKAGMMAASAFDLYKPGDMFAATLTFDNVFDSKKFEPGAALPQSRINALKMAHSMGIKTWVSFEPALDADQIMSLFFRTKDFVDFYKFGKVSRFDSKITDWKAFANEMIELCDMNGKDYLLKNDLLKYVKE